MGELTDLDRLCKCGHKKQDHSLGCSNNVNLVGGCYYEERIGPFEFYAEYARVRSCNCAQYRAMDGLEYCSWIKAQKEVPKQEIDPEKEGFTKTKFVPGFSDYMIELIDN